MSLCVFLRVPPLLIIDRIISISFGFQDIDGIIIALNDIFGNSILSQFENGDVVKFFVDVFLPICLFIKIIASCLVFCLSLCILVLPTRYLYPVFLHVAPICVVFFSTISNVQTLNVLTKHYTNLEINTINEALTWDVIIRHFTQLHIFNYLCFVFSNIALQFCLSLIFNFLQVCATNHSIYKVACISFMIPTLITFITGSHGIFYTVTVFVFSLLPLCILPERFWLNISTLLHLIYDGYNHIRVIINSSRNEVKDFVVTEWSRLKMPSVLRLFWAIRLLDLFILSLLTKKIKHETFFGTVKYLLVKGCGTFTAVLGMTSFVSYFCHYIGAFFQWVLLTENMREAHIGKRSAILFIILASLTGFTDLEPEECFLQIFRNVSLVCGFLMFFIHGLVDTLLISLSINRNKSINRHLRALLVSGFLIVFPMIMLRYLWYYDFSYHQLLEFSSLNFQIVVRVLVTLAVYLLHMIDGYHNTIWEKLDDYEFYINSFGDAANFCFSTSIFLSGVYNLPFEYFGIAYILVMCVYAYLVVWRSIRDGWRVLIKRRLAIRRVESLADATSVQLSEFDDICSICRHNMDSAKITKCNHYFHSICLRKWLNLKDNCPVCQNILYQA